ncbi:hypothetical protein Aperf_G00000021182 [Anoplocephala perfoliata]
MLDLTDSGEQSPIQIDDKLYFLKEKARFLKKLQSQGTLCNCTINVDGQLFNVHLEILCASSEYFDNVIRHDLDFKDTVSLHNMTPSTFQIVLDYLYTGIVDIDSSNVVDIYIAADFLILNSLLDRCRSFFCDPDDVVLNAAVEILNLYDDSEIFNTIIKKRNLFRKRGSLFAVQSMLLIARMPTSDASVDLVDDARYEPWANFDPGTWAISKIVFYIIPFWGDAPGLIGGADVEYRNIWSGERKMSTSPLRDFLPSNYITKVLELEEGETVNAIWVNSGWLVDQMVLSTSKGRQVGPFGHSRGGDRREVQIPKQFKVTFPEETPNDENFSCLALHGFSYSLVRTRQCPSWFNVAFVYSAVRTRLDVKGLKI